MKRMLFAYMDTSERGKKKKKTCVYASLFGEWLHSLASAWKPGGEKEVVEGGGGWGGAGFGSGPGREVAWLGRGRGRNSPGLYVRPCTGEEVEQQRRAGVARLSHCSRHLLLGQRVTAASLCLACVRPCVCASGGRVKCAHEWTRISLTTRLALPSPDSLSAVWLHVYVCVRVCACVLMSGVLSPLTLSCFPSCQSQVTRPTMWLTRGSPVLDFSLPVMQITFITIHIASVCVCVCVCMCACALVLVYV